MHMSRRLSFLTTILAGYLLAQSNGTLGSQAELISRMGQLNSTSTLDPAGSSGLLGLRVGMGANAVSYKESLQESVTTLLQNTEPAAEDILITPRLWINKEILYPVSLSITMGQISENVTQMGGSLQWTVFEAFAMPAVAARLGYSKLFGLAKTNLETTEMELRASWGIAFFSLYAGYGIHYHTWDSDSFGNETLEEQEQIAGLSINALPPFFTLGFEMRKPRYSEATYAAKMSLEI